jgi:kynureninase
MEPIDRGPFPDQPGHDEAVALDRADPLRGFADQFVPAEPGLIYLDGNSLGRLPRAAVPHLRNVIEHEWGERLIRSWPDRWWDLSDQIGSSIAGIVGADPGRVIVTDSTSVALFKLTVGALRARSDRKRIVTDDLNFPTDAYVTNAAADLLGGREVVTVPSHDGIHGPADALIDALDGDTALLTLSHVVFKSGYRYDMERLTRAAHDAGALVLWDLSHAVGAVPVDLDATGADLAVGCTYKYLNGGPGAPAFLYVNDGVDDEIENPIAGWWGHENPFAFDPIYTPVRSIRRFQTGTMPILSLSAVETGIALTIEAGMERIRAKSVGLSEFFIEQSRTFLEPLGFRLASPLDASYRGSHISLGHPDGWRVVRAMVEQAGIIPDFREPDNIRLGFAPLYTSYVDVHTAVVKIADIVTSGRHTRYDETRGSVT